MVGKYKVITLCGSTRFKDAFMSEIGYAVRAGKPVRYLQEPGRPAGTKGKNA